MCDEFEELASAFLGAVQDENDQQIEELLHKAGSSSSRKRLIQATNKDNKTALHFAAEQGRLDLVNYLTKEGADVNAKGGSNEAAGRTPLHSAVICFYADVADALLKNGAKLDVTDALGLTPLDHAVALQIVYANKEPRVRPIEANVEGESHRYSVRHPSENNHWWEVFIRLLDEIISFKGSNNVDWTKFAIWFADAEMWELCKCMVEMGGAVDRLSDDAKFNLLCKVASSSDLTISAHTDTKVRNALFNTIRLGNVELFKLLMDKWRIEYSDNPKLLKHVDGLLGLVYEEIKYKGVVLSNVMEFVVEDRLLDSRFSIVNNPDTCKDVTASIETVKKRAKLICDSIEAMRSRYGGDSGKDGIDEAFIFRARFIAQNIHILKRQLKSTYNKLPWEEIDCCITSFVSACTNRRQLSALVLLVMDEEKLLRHLENFATHLQKVMDEVQDKDVNSKFPKISARSRCIAKVKHLNPCFLELYKDHESIRTALSLERIEGYVEIAVKVDLDSRSDVGKLVIERTLQVLGETLKNTLESPNVSDSVNRRLVASAPRNLNKIITGLRDKLSHAYTLKQKLDIEEKTNPNFFSEVQNDLNKVAVDVCSIFYNMKRDALVAFMDKLAGCNDLVVATKAKKLLSDIDFREMEFEVQGVKELDKISRLIEECKREIGNLTDQEIGAFNEVEEALRSRINKLKRSKVRYDKIQNYLMECFFGNILNIEIVRHFAQFSACDKSLEYLLPKIAALIKIIPDRPDRYQILRKLSQAFHCVTFESPAIETIDELRVKLEHCETEKNLENAAQEAIETGLKEIVQNSNVEDKKKLQQKLDDNLQKKREMHVWKIELSGYLENNDSKSEERCIALFGLLKAKKAQKMFENGDICACKKIVARMNNEYQTLLNNAIKTRKPEDIQPILLTFVKSVEKNFIPAGKSQTHSLDEMFLKRLEKLKVIIDWNGDRLAFIATYKNDKALQFAVEMLVLDLMETLGNMSLLADNRLFLDRSSPILTGRCLRNYLAHGDHLIDILPFDTSLSIICNAFKLVDYGPDFVAKKNTLIGQQIGNECSYMTDQKCRLFALGDQQTDLFNAAEEGSLGSVKDCIKMGGVIQCRSTVGRKLLKCVACKANKEAIMYFLEQQKLIHFGCNFISKHLLYYATKHGNCAIVEYLMDDKKVILDSLAFQGTESLLQLAAKCGHENVVKFLLSKDTTDVNYSGRDSRPALHHACMRGNIEIVNMLIEKGADINAGDKNGTTALHLAAMSGQTEVACKLISKGASVDCDNEKHCTPLLFASCFGHRDFVIALIKKGACIEGSPRDSETPLLTAITMNQVGVVKALLENGACVHAEISLHNAAYLGRKEIVSLLLDHLAPVNDPCVGKNTHLMEESPSASNSDHLLLDKGAYANEITEHNIRQSAREDIVNLLDKNKMTPMHHAAECGHENVISLLIENGASVNALDKSGRSPLLLAAMNGHKSAVRMLIEKGATDYVVARSDNNEIPAELTVANVGLPDEGNSMSDELHNPLFCAALNGYDDVVIALLSEGCDINSHGDKMLTPLHAAVYKGHVSTVNILLKSRPDVNARNNEGSTPLHLAGYNTIDDIVLALIKGGADVHARDDEGSTPLHTFVKYHSYICAIALLRNGANPNVIDSENCTPLVCAIKDGHIDMVRKLLEYNALVNFQNNIGMTPLHYAVNLSHENICKEIIDKGADVNLRDMLGSTCLHKAVGHMKIVELLLNSKAEVDAKDNWGLTPLYLAVIFGQEDVASLLLTAGADVNASLHDGLMPIHFASHIGDTRMVQILLNHNDDTEITKSDSIVSLRNLPKLLDFIREVLYRQPNTSYDHLLDITSQNDRYDIWGSLIKICNHIYEGNFTELNSERYGVQNLCICFLSMRGTGSMNSSWREVTTLLHQAVAYNIHSAVKMLLDSGEEVNATDANMFTPLHMAADRDVREVMQTLLKRRADLEAKNNYGMTPLHVAVNNGHENIALDLIVRGADINAIDDDGITPLHFAVAEGHNNIALDLIARRACIIDAKDNNDLTPLHYAAMLNRMEILFNLLVNGANIYALTTENSTPLHLAAAGGCVEALVVLLEKGAKIESKDINQFTALHRAANAGHKDSVVYLLDSRANIEAVALKNMTALHLAVYYGHRNVVAALLERGANPMAVTSDKESAFDLAVKFSHVDIAQNLKFHWLIRIVASHVSKM